MLSFLLPPIIGGVIGYITNDIAIRMLFRPHTPKYVFGLHIPFTPGIIPKEKERLSESIGKTISDNLINQEVMERYLLSDEMIEKIRGSVLVFIEKQKENHESVRIYLSRYIKEEELQTIAASINNNLTKETCKKLTEPIIGETVAKLVMDYVGKMLSGDGAKILLAGIGGMAKGLGGLAASILGVDVITKFLSILREPTERFLASNINTMMKDNSQQIVSGILRNEADTFLDMPVSELLQRYDDQISQLPQIFESFYKKMIAEHLPHILSSINISYIVSERINEMDMNELEPMILEVMDKELKAVVWFGAGLGALMGCLNILF